MRAPLPPVDLPDAGAGWVVTGCQRVAVGEQSSLVRLSVRLDGVEPGAIAGALLLVADGAHCRRHPGLPSPPLSRSAQLTLGFAVSRTETALALEIGGRSLPLPEFQPQPPSAPAPHDWVPHAPAPRGRVPHAPAPGDAASRRPAPRAQRAPARAHLARRVSLGVCATAVAVGLMATVFTVLNVRSGDGAAGAGVAGAATAGAGPSRAALRVRAANRVRAVARARRLQIPVEYLELYRRAGASYGLDWTRLAAVGAVESRHGQALTAGIDVPADPLAASGPAQFLASTWERFGVDGDGDGLRDPRDPGDAIPAMASYLRASGAPQDWRGALRSYNHSDAYVEAVQRQAARYRQSVAREPGR